MRNHIDYHIHTIFSSDGYASMQDVCRAALERGLTEIAITDHVDFEPMDGNYDYFRPDDYWQEIETCRVIFEGRLMVRAGIECGEGHRFRSEIDAILHAHPYDLVLGSLHWAAGRPAWKGSFFDDGLDRQQGLALYFEELASLAAQADYDVLAHLDFVRRATFLHFGPQEWDLRPYEDAVRRVLRIVAGRGKALEVNTSMVRRDMDGPSPPAYVVRWFREEGGRAVTLGSDAHRAGEVGADLDLALDQIQQAGFEGPALFQHREALKADQTA